MIRSKIKKNIVISLSTFMLFVSSGQYIYGEGNRAYSYGTDYGSGDIKTAVDAQYAKDKYKQAGLASYSNSQPTYSYLSGKTASGNIRMTADVLFFSGHGNKDSMTFNYLKKGGDYATGIYRTSNKSFTGTAGKVTYKCVGLPKSYMSKVRLIVFAGCQTAKGTTNLAQMAVDNGAKTAIGWPESIGAVSHTSWLKRFNSKLATGATVSQARTYANGFTYDDDRVKKAKILGNTKTNIKPTSKTMINDDLDESITIDKHLSTESKEDNLVPVSLINNNTYAKNELNLLKNINLSKLNKKYIVDIVENYNKELNKQDYTYEINKIDDLNGTIDIKAKLKNIDTDSIMTIIVENGKIVDINKLSIYKNGELKDINLEKIKKEYKINNLSQKKINDIKDNARKDIELKGYKVLSQNGKVKYDLVENKCVYVLLSEYIDEFGTNGVEETIYY